MTTDTQPPPSAEDMESFGKALADRLPGTWTAASAPLNTTTAQSAMNDRLWDLAHAQWALGTFVYESAELLRGPAGRELLVLPSVKGRHIVAALVPEVLGSAYDHEDLAPHGITVAADPARAAHTVTTRLLPRYDVAIDLALDTGYPAYDLYAPTTPVSDDVPLRAAVRTVLLAAELTLADASTGLADALSRGVEFTRDRLVLDDDLLPLVEAAATQALLAAAGTTTSALDPHLRNHLRHLAQLPHADQLLLLRRTTDPGTPSPSARAHAAQTRTTALPVAAVTCAQAAPPQAVTANAPAPHTR